jgi:hypothetical protein
MVPRLIAAFALATLAAPAQADIRADYVNERGMVVNTVEIDDSGQIRIGNPGGYPGGGYYLATTDGEYFVEPGPGGPVAISLEAAAWLARGRSTEGFSSADWEPPWHYEPAGEVRVGRFVGRAWRPLTDAGLQRLPSIVISEDPALAPIGLALVREGRAFLRRNNRPDVLDAYNTLLLKGAPLANANDTLGAVSFEPLPPEHFRLPVAPTTLADVTVAQGSQAPAEPEPEGPRPSVIQAAFWDRALWTLDDSGGVWRAREGGQELSAVEIPGPGIAICRAPDALWLVTRPSETKMALWTHGAAGWDARGEIEGAIRSQPGIECSGDRPLLFLGDKVVEFGGRTFRFSDAEAPPRGYPVLLRSGDALYVGLNAGEWGGGLRRIDLRTESGEIVEAGETRRSCGGVLNFRCAPVTGLAPDPARPGCLLAAVGLVHMMLASGEVVRVCGNVAERLYRKPYTLDPQWRDEDITEITSTVPFFAMAGGEGAAWAVGADGLYRFGTDPAPELHRFPAVRAGGVDWSHPEVVLVPTTMNQRHSVSGGSLLLVPR